MPAGPRPSSRALLAAATILAHTDEPLLVLGVADPAELHRLGKGCQRWHEQHAWWPHNPRMSITRNGETYTLHRLQANRTAGITAVTAPDPLWARADACLVAFIALSAGETIESMLTRFPDACMTGQVYLCEVDITGREVHGQH